MEFKGNYFHSVDGTKLCAEPVYFDLVLDADSSFSICIDLECGGKITANKALIQFTFTDPDSFPEKHGLVRSGNPDIGWYRYICTLPGKARTHFDLAPWPGFQGAVRIGIRSWQEDDDAVLKSFMAVSNLPPKTLSEKYAKCRNVDRYQAQVWNSIGEFLSTKEILSGLHTIPLNDLLLDFCLVVRGSAPLLCFLHGNVPRNDNYMLPSLSGWTVTQGIDASLLMISDPSLLLDREVQLAWHAGTSSVPLQYVYELILEKINAVLRPAQMIFWGGSGGGFASLYLSSKFEKSIAFVWNPQTSIMDYEEKAVMHYGKSCVECEPADALESFMTDRIVSNVAKMYPHAKNTVIYLQNATDWHTKIHLVPFLEKIGFERPENGYSGWLSDTIYIHLDDLSSGHNPPPAPIIKNLLSGLTSSDVKKLDIKRLIAEALPAT